MYWSKISGQKFYDFTWTVATCICLYIFLTPSLISDKTHLSPGKPKLMLERVLFLTKHKQIFKAKKTLEVHKRSRTYFLMLVIPHMSRQLLGTTVW